MTPLNLTESPTMSHVTFPNRNGQGITMAAIVHFPPHFDERKQYPAVVVSHPGGG